MKLKGLALVSIAVLLSMSGAANGAGINTLPQSRMKPSPFATRSFGTGSGEELFKPRTTIGKTSVGDGLPRKNVLAARKNQTIPEAGLKKVSSLFDEATPRILDNLGHGLPGDPRAPITEQSLERIINEQLTKVINNAAKMPNSGLTFEALTGNLKVDWSYTTPVGKVTAGQINIYKVSAAVVGPIIACWLSQEDLSECAKTILAGVQNKLKEEMHLDLPG